MESVSWYKIIEKQRKPKIKSASKKMKPVSENTRYNRFVPRTHHRLVREGIELTTSPDNVRGELTEAHLYHFEHTDDAISRPQKYKGVLKCVLEQGTVYVEPHDEDYKQMYKDRTDTDACDDIMPDGTPYWTDVYNLRMKRKHHL
jgi:hypothetical protein